MVLDNDELKNSLPEDTAEVSWTASEFIAHEKSAGWYINLIIAAVLLAGVVYILTRDLVSPFAVLIGAVFFGIFAARPPRQLTYTLNHRGIQAGPKQYAFDNFKSFSVTQEAPFPAINLMPLKRFAPLLTIYYDPAQEQQILSVLAQYLPFEEAKKDRIESLMHRIRF